MAAIALALVLAYVVIKEPLIRLTILAILAHAILTLLNCEFELLLGLSWIMLAACFAKLYDYAIQFKKDSIHGMAKQYSRQ